MNTRQISKYLYLVLYQIPVYVFILMSVVEIETLQFEIMPIIIAFLGGHYSYPYEGGREGGKGHQNVSVN